MIEEIKIKINNNLIDKIYLINYKDKTCVFDNERKKISEKDLNIIMNNIVLLNKEYISNKLIDAEEFTITVNGQTVSHGKGIYPIEYINIKQIIGDLND